MKRVGVAVSAIAFSASLFAAEGGLSTEKDKLSYAIGYDLGRNFKQQSIPVDPNTVAQGMNDVMGGKPSLMSEQEVKQTLQTFQKKRLMERVAAYKKQAQANKTEGDAFLATNKLKPGVKTTKSGLQYKIIKPGTGQPPKVSDTVTVEYTGKLINGTVFDSSSKNGKPAVFALDQVIKGWTEALLMMKPGGEWEIVVPPDLAYGTRGVGGPIGPNQTLIFNIKLISVSQGKVAAAAATTTTSAQATSPAQTPSSN